MTLFPPSLGWQCLHPGDNQGAGGSYGPIWAALNVRSNEWVMGLVVTRPAVPGASVCNIAVLSLSITQYSGVMAGG